MCWHTVTLRLNTKLFFVPLSLPGSKREVNLWRCSCLPWLLWIGRFLKLSECSTAPSLCRDSVKVHTCEESGATGGLATELSRSNPPGPRLLLVTFLHPLSSLFLRSSPHSSVCSTSVRPLYSPSLTAMRQTQKATALSALGVLCFLFIKLWEWHRVTEKVPRWQKTRAFLQRTINFHRSERKTFMDETKEKGFSNNLRKVQKTLLRMLRQSCIEEIFFFFLVCVSL